MISNTGVTKHVVYHSHHEIFGAFDELPAVIRKALNEANLKYDPVWILNQWKTNRLERSPERFAADMLAHFEDFERTLK